MEIRPAEDADFNGIVRLLASKAELFWIYPRGEHPFSLEQLRNIAAVRKELTVVVNGGTVAGFADLYDIVPNQSAFIGNVVIDSALRGKGWGRALVSHMVELGRRAYGLAEMRISVFSENTRALLLYSSLNFKPYAIEERTDPAGRKVALIHMASGLR